MAIKRFQMTEADDRPWTVLVGMPCMDIVFADPEQSVQIDSEETSTESPKESS